MGQYLSTESNVANDNLPSANILINNNNNMNVNNNSRGPYNPGKRRQNRKKVAMEKNLSLSELQQLTLDVLCLIHYWFPRLHEQTYYLPPVHMNRVKLTETKVGGTTVQQIDKTPESDWRDDEVMQRALYCIRNLTDSRQEPMVVLLQVQHDNYMNKPCYEPAAKLYPRPRDLPTNLKRGDFDLLFLHKHYGIIVAEIKSVGWRPGEEQGDAIVKKKVKQAIEQLNKADKVLTYLVNDLKPAPKVTKTLILPNVSTARLLVLLDQDPQMASEFCSCFNVPDVSSALELCLCSQQMTPLEQPAEVTASILKELDGWWQRLVANGGYNEPIGCDPEETADVYELVVARFCGPASTVQVHCVQAPRLEFRTLGDAVQEVGERMIQFALFPEQLAILQEEERCVYLTGPPGTGKTLLLVLIALKWSREGKQVHIVSTGTYSEAATQLLFYQVRTTLEKTNKEAVSRIHIHLNGNSFKPLPAIVHALTISASAGSAEGSRDHNSEGLMEGPQKRSELYVVADEVGESFMEFYHDLHNNVPDLHIWAATYRKEHRPEGMREKVVSACLRSPPVVMRRMQTAISFADDASGVHKYVDKREDYLGHADGPTELFLSHVDHTDSHVVPAMDCAECGHDIASLLHNTLHVGKQKTVETATGLRTPSPLQYSDVIIIPDFYQDPADGIHDNDLDNGVRDNNLDPDNNVRRTSGIVRGLREAGVPTYVVKKQDGDSIRVLAQASRDAVAVVAWGVSNGLERKVVVSVGEGRQTQGRVSGVLHGASRCVSQLIYVKCPESYVSASES